VSKKTNDTKNNEQSTKDNRLTTLFQELKTKQKNTSEFLHLILFLVCFHFFSL